MVDLVGKILNLKNVKPTPNEFFKNFSIDNIQAIIFDFDGVFTNNKVYVDQNGNEIVNVTDQMVGPFDLLRKFLKENH